MQYKIGDGDYTDVPNTAITVKNDWTTGVLIDVDIPSDTWSEDNVLSIHFRAKTNAPTVLNLTHHSYFNLGGEGSGSIENHLLQLNANQYLETDEHQVPTGRLIPVVGTAMDFSHLRSLKPGLESNYHGDKTNILKD